MPVRSRGNGCYQWGHHGKVYCGPGARAKAERQGRAAYSHGYRGHETSLREAEQLSAPQIISLTELELATLEAFGALSEPDQPGVGGPAALVASEMGVATAKVTQIAKKLAGDGLLHDTGYAMRRERGKFGKGWSWQYIDRPKNEGGMLSKPGASTVWAITDAGRAVLGA